MEGEARDGSLEHGPLLFRRAQDELAQVNDQVRKIRQAA
jgi:exonuclease VII small subunit